MENQLSSVRNQWAVLAGLRFVLAALVVITHSVIVAPGSAIGTWLGETGYPAVFGFLMISGFSIGASITKSQKGYFLRRVKRIYPAYIAAILFAVAVTLGGALRLPAGQMIGVPSVETVLGNVFMLQGILVPFIPADGPLWSLSIEWWCYMLGAVLFRLSVGVSKVVTLVSFVAMMAFCLKTHSIAGSELPLGLNVPLMLWGWLAGFVYFREQSRTNFLIMLLMPLLMFEWVIHLKMASTVIVVSALSILFAKDVAIKSERTRAALNFLGDASYPLYLFHAPMLFFIGAKTSLRNGNEIVLIIVATVLLGYYLVTRSKGIIFRTPAPPTPAR